MIPDLAGLNKKNLQYRFSMDRWDFKECKKNPDRITFGPFISENTVARVAFTINLFYNNINN